MITLILAAAVAAQPAPPASPQGQMMPMNPEHHEGMKKEKCCCGEMGKEEHDMHAHDAHSQRGE